MKKKIFKVLTITISLSLITVGTVFAVQEPSTEKSVRVDIVNTQAAKNNTLDATKDSILVVTDTEAAILEVAASEATKETSESDTTGSENTEAATPEATKAATQNNTVSTQAAATQVQAVQETQAQVSVVDQPEVGKQLTDGQANSMAYQNADTYSAYVNEIVTLINQERIAAGVSTVSYDSTLTIVAMHRSIENAWMNSMEVKDGRHIRPNGEKASTICNYYGLYGSYGEILGRYQTSPSQIVSGWHDSATHYSCMTSTKYTRVGVGIAKSADGFLYWTAVFMN